MHYFASDGSYRDAEGIIVVDTTDWTEDEWSLINDAPDSERAAVAAQLEREHYDQPELPLSE